MACEEQNILELLRAQCPDVGEITEANLNRVMTYYLCQIAAGGGGGGGNVTIVNPLPLPVDEEPIPFVPHNITTGTNVNIPIGAQEIIINNLTGTNTIDFGGGNTFTLTNGDSLTLTGEVSNNAIGTLPAVTISGGTWQWIAKDPL